MIRAIHKSNFYIDNRIACNDAALSSLFDAIANGRDELFWNSAPSYFIYKLHAATLFTWRKFNQTMSILASSTALPYELSFAPDGCCNCLLIGYHGLTDSGCNLEFPEKSVYQYLQVQFPHARDNR